MKARQRKKFAKRYNCKTYKKARYIRELIVKYELQTPLLAAVYSAKHLMVD